MFTTGNTHLKYRKHPVHSAAHKLKIRSSWLVPTTAGTVLDSTDRAAMGGGGGGAKNSSASEPLKRPILSLWNSRGMEFVNGDFYHCASRSDAGETCVTGLSSLSASTRFHPIWRLPMTQVGEMPNSYSYLIISD